MHRKKRRFPKDIHRVIPCGHLASLPQRAIYFEHQEARALIRGDWKLVWGKRMPWQIDWELYNLKRDRCETTDLADKYPRRVRQLADEWLGYAKRVGLHPFYLSE